MTFWVFLQLMIKIHSNISLMYFKQSEGSWQFFKPTLELVKVNHSAIMKCQSIFSYTKISFFKPEIPQKYLLFSFKELSTLTNVSCIGTGLQNLRECILWTQTKHDFEPKKKRPFWKQMSKNFIERYVYLIVFTTYVKAFSHRGM